MKLLPSNQLYRMELIAVIAAWLIFSVTYYVTGNAAAAAAFAATAAAAFAAFAAFAAAATTADKLKITKVRATTSVFVVMVVLWGLFFVSSHLQVVVSVAWVP